MNMRIILAIARKDLMVISRSRGVLLPLILVPLLLFVVIPGAMALAMPYMMNMPGSNLGSIEQALASLPATMQQELSRFQGGQRLLAYILLYMFAPLFLVVPMMTASVIAADSFAGEKERKTLEALLYTPTSDRQLFIGKLLSAMVPAILVSLGGFVLYSIVANAAAWPMMGRIFFPNAMWLVLVIWVSPAVAALALGTMIIVSQRVSSFQEAYQLGAMVVLPVLLLLYAQAAGVMFLSVQVVLLVGLIFWLIDIGLFWYGVKTFQRAELIAKV